MKQINYKKLILPNIPYVFIALLITKVSEAARLAPGADLSGKLLNIMTGMSTAFQSIMPSFHPIDLCVGIAAAVVIRLVVYFKGKNAKKFRKNLEYGSARWGNADDIRPYVDPVFENNIILTQTECLTMNNRPKDPKTARNKNVLIIGGSGSGKTRFWLKPNLLQCTSKTYPVSFVVTDPKGSIKAKSVLTATVKVPMAEWNLTRKPLPLCSLSSSLPQRAITAPLSPENCSAGIFPPPANTRPHGATTPTTYPAPVGFGVRQRFSVSWRMKDISVPM